VEVANQNIPLHWTATPGADRYLVQVSRFAAFTVRDFEMVVTDTTVTVPQLLANFNFFWRVRPFNSLHIGDHTPFGQFKTVLSTSTEELETSDWSCYPSVLAPGEALQLRMPASASGGRCMVYNAMGQLMHEQELPKGAEQATLPLPSSNWSTGVYRLVYIGERQTGNLSFVLKG
jgi:hypothetical protein